jgi:hypothetical protein
MGMGWFLLLDAPVGTQPSITYDIGGRRIEKDDVGHGPKSRKNEKGNLSAHK